MMPLVIAFPAIEPEIFRFGPFALRWYAVAYIAGIVIGWRLALRLADQRPRFMTRIAIDDFVAWVTLGVILGGRLGYVIFYKPLYYLANPLEILAHRIEELIETSRSTRGRRRGMARACSSRSSIVASARTSAYILRLWRMPHANL